MMITHWIVNNANMWLLHVVNDNVMMHMWVCIYEKVGFVIQYGVELYIIYG